MSTAKAQWESFRRRFIQLTTLLYASLELGLLVTKRGSLAVGDVAKCYITHCEMHGVLRKLHLGYHQQKYTFTIFITVLLDQSNSRSFTHISFLNVTRAITNGH